MKVKMGFLRTDKSYIMHEINKQIDFIKEIDKVKYIQRKTCLFNSNRHENDAEHSWTLALLVLVLAKHANEDIDVLKVLKMVLLHDIVEIDAGDTFLFDTKKEHDNTKEERKAAQRIFGMLPKDQAEEFMAVWEEFETGDTPESRFARAIDNLEPMLQNASNHGGTWAEFDVSYERVFARKEKIRHGSEKVWAYALKLMDESVEQGFLNKDSKQ